MYTSNAKELCCPTCSGSNVHLVEMCAATRMHDDAPQYGIAVESTGSVVTGPYLEVPQPRTVGHHRFALRGWCEQCDGMFALVFTEDGGVTYADIVELVPREDRRAS